MKEEDKRLIIESVGLCWHEAVGKHHCICGDYSSSAIRHIDKAQLKPLNPADMEKIWEAFSKSEHYYPFKLAQMRGANAFEGVFNLFPAPKRAQAMLEYFKEGENT